MINKYMVIKQLNRFTILYVRLFEIIIGIIIEYNDGIW